MKRLWFILFLLIATNALSATKDVTPRADGEGGLGTPSLSWATSDIDALIVNTSLEIPNSTTLPATCAVGQIYMDTDATTGQRLYACQSTNTWALQGDGGGGSVEGTAVLSTGEVGGTKFLREDGDGTSSWQTISGGGDALVANPLSQFAATTSSQLAGVLSDETGTDKVVYNTSPTLVTPVLGVATATSINKVAITAPATGSTLTIADGATLTASATATVSGTNTGDQTTVSGNAGTVTFADAGGDTTTFVALGTAATGSLAPATDAGLSYNATTNALTASTFVGALTGNADTVTTNANLTGDVTSSGNATTISANSVALTTDTTGNYAAGNGEAGDATSLAADGLNALTEIDQAIKTAANDTSKLVVGVVGLTDECAKWDANGNLVSAGAACGTSSGAPVDADYLVGTANGGLSAEIVVGTSPGGELGGTWASPTIDDSITVTGWVLGTSSATTLTAGTVNIDLLDAVGAVDMDYGSVDITDHTFVTDGTGTAEIVLPAGSIDSTEVLDSTLTASDMADSLDFGGDTSFEIPNGASPTVDAAGEIAVDTTDDQLVYYGAAKRVIPYERTAGVVIENLAAADDNYAFFMANDAITVTGVGCNCRGTCSTGATFTLEDRGGNAMTITGTNPTCATTGAATFAAVTAGNTLTAGEMVAFDVTNTPTADDEYSLMITYTVDAQ